MYLATGLGVLNCPGDPGCPGNVQPDVPVPPDVQQQIADLWSYLWEGPGSASIAVPVGTTAPTMTDVLNQNAGKIAVGAGAFLLLMMFAKAGR